MPLQAVATQRLYRQIADQLAELIRSGEFPPGERLPSERDLAQQLGVSRASVREALIALEIDGLIDIRVGSGVYVTARRVAAANSMLVAEPGPFEVLAARGLVEGETAALAAANATVADLARIRETLSLMREEFDARASALDGDALFHVRIAEASANGALAHLVKQLWDFRQGSMFRKIDQHFDVPARHAAAIGEHLAVIEAIERRDAEAARAAMLRHLDNVKLTLARSLELPPASRVADGAAAYS
jgi:DNA-binding FadR family transcriptional regulator